MSIYYVSAFTYTHGGTIHFLCNEILSACKKITVPFFFHQLCLVLTLCAVFWVSRQ